MSGIRRFHDLTNLGTKSTQLPSNDNSVNYDCNCSSDGCWGDDDSCGEHNCSDP